MATRRRSRPVKKKSPPRATARKKRPKQPAKAKKAKAPPPRKKRAPPAAKARRAALKPVAFDEAETQKVPAAEVVEDIEIQLSLDLLPSR